MQDIFYIESVDQANTALKPMRIEILRRLDEPRTCPELAEALGETPQKIYYHVKQLQKAGMVEKVEERRVRGVVEGYYQAVARAYWLAPDLVSEIGGTALTQDQVSLRYLLSLAQELHNDVAQLGQRSESGQETPSLALSAHIQLPDGTRRAAFMRDVQRTFQDLARQYGLPDGKELAEEDSFRLMLACYPHAEEPE
ncbi:MAG: ArsR family transcriptional regulator [Chloroflexi bacterium]|nr:MAG: ArsR family transcriptional regulator [Chloroflexota bacterium]MBL1194929.1 ArsR family transcriptional regulator [Chloroflexota bacterium]NOH12220.1 helix-turn-helix transcriptional regulator [Chloroflexota bacterium]